MKYSDINKMFTTEVNKYLAQGYRFNTASMNGSQGELAKVDLTNGTEIIRIVACTFSKEWDKQGIELFVGRVAEKEGIRPTTISDYYNEIAERMNLNHLDLICEALDCEPDEILVRVPNPEPRVRNRTGFEKPATESKVGI